MPRRRVGKGNAVAEAEALLGGEAGAWYKLHVPPRTWARWRADGEIPLTKWAVRVSKKTGIPVERFAPGWDEQ